MKRNLGKMAANGLQHLLGKHETWIARSKDGNRTFFETGQFPWIRELEEDVSIIQGELERVVLDRIDLVPNFQEVSEEQTDLTQDDRWKTFVLYAYGVRVPRNCRRCPETARLLKKIPGMRTAMFSILTRKKHIPPHRGPYKGVLRYHLALRVPQPAGACRIRVGNDIASWQEGKSLVFDDTHEHEAWNDTEQMRAVLFVSFLRPLPFPLWASNAAMVKLISKSPFIRNWLTGLAKWEEVTGVQFDDK